MQQLYLVRFYVEIADHNKEPKTTAIKELEKRELYGDLHNYIDDRTFFDEGGSVFWFEKQLRFVPFIGMGVSHIPLVDYSWGLSLARKNDTFPIVVSIEYRVDFDMFIVQLDWGVWNSLQIARHIQGNIQKLTRQKEVDRDD